MDPTRFDSLTQRLVAIPSRRALLHAIGGLLTAGALTAAESDARRKRKPKKCKGGKRKCGKTCIPKSNCCTSAECDADETCRNGSCAVSPCPPNQTRCDGQCVNTLTDAANCGGCGLSCAAGETCRLGDCCQSLGETCVSEDQCCFSFCGAIDEEKPNGQDCRPGVSKRCCADGDIPCLDTCDCCGSLICLDQQCCVASGQPCSNNAQCCSRTCGPVGTGPTCA